MTSETIKLVRELAGTKCQCGGRKRERQTFCGKCYFKLSTSQRQALYRRVGEGYEEAYADAMKTLKPKPIEGSFDEHLTGCEQCRNHPFDLCRVGDHLIRTTINIRQ